MNMLNIFKRKREASNDTGLSMAVLSKVQEYLGGEHNATTQWLHNPPRATLDAFRGRINALRVWSQSLDGDIRSAYLKWTDFYQRGLDGTYEELETGNIRRGQERFNQRLESEFEQKCRAEASGAIPTPPKQ